MEHVQYACQLNSMNSNILISTHASDIQLWLFTTVVQNMTALVHVITLNYKEFPTDTWNVNLD